VTHRYEFPSNVVLTLIAHSSSKKDAKQKLFVATESYWFPKVVIVPDKNTLFKQGSFVVLE
jgi:hypothetical protein